MGSRRRRATAANPRQHLRPELAHPTRSPNKIILNCVGPFGLHGQPVVSAYVDSGCDYLDICGEPEFMERMEALYHERAVEKGSLVISACGFDSIPAEMGMIFHSRQWAGSADPNRVEAYLSLASGKRMVGNYDSWTSTTERIDHRTPQGARSLGCKATISRFNHCAKNAIHPRRKSHGLPGVNENPEHVKKREAFWPSVKPAHFGVKLGTKPLLGLFSKIMLGIFLRLLCKFSFGRWLLLRYPSFFSLGWFKKEGSSEDEVASVTFKMLFVGHGFSDGS
ncbi:hypothetical protein BUALT_Bualt16G0027100 [Buddleja alternifolia]|uniref:Saccharopine dehydrogenase n=1 Tax=Buddleja alternifolia TaxID=168488 RepID=A0AAV6WF34_9LAMI|nr:hypothetical protein BUALT_Bualt16G0027100 [Buddleja alternifolia]